MRDPAIKRCWAYECTAEPELRGLCRRHYKRLQNILYWEKNRAEILLHQKVVRRIKRSE